MSAIATAASIPHHLRRERRHNPYDAASANLWCLTDTGAAVPEYVECDAGTHQWLMTGQWSFAVTARGMRNALRLHAGITIVAASNVKPKNHRGKLQGGMWNVLVRVEDVRAFVAFRWRMLFVTATSYRVFATAAEAAACVADRDGGAAAPEAAALRRVAALRILHGGAVSAESLRAAAVMAQIPADPAALAPMKVKGVAGMKPVTVEVARDEVPPHVRAIAAAAAASNAAPGPVSDETE
jgi:hypothetical protein